MVDNYPKAYKEVLEVLKYVPSESIHKIPKEKINMFKNKMDKSWDFKIDINKNFAEQNLLDETRAIFANIFKDYWATSYQKEKIEERESYELQKIEKEKREKYNPDEIFGKKEIKERVNEFENNLPVEVREERIFKRIIIFFKKILKII